MQTAGVLIKSWGISQQSFYLMKNLNLLHSLNTYLDVVVFFRDNPVPGKIPLFASLSEYEAWGFNGPVLATDLYTAERLIACPRPHPKYFYIFDLEWIYQPLTKFKEKSNIYNNDQLQLIARNQYHFDIIKKVWREPVAIIDDFNHIELTKLFTEGL